MAFVCPQCKRPLENFFCAACRREYPIICGIPDFRLHPDPYISIEEDRRKGEALFRAGAGRTFEEILRYYYAITPEDPADLAVHWIAHALAEVEIAQLLLSDARLTGTGQGALLDVGCSTGALLIAAKNSFERLTGVDVAFRWLIIGQLRLREAGVTATLVCANAESLPFPDQSFDTVTANDVIEHVHDAQTAMTEAHRTLKPGGRMVCTGNNRYAPLPDPQVRLWGVGLLPVKWQSQYVAWRRRDLHRYHVRMRSLGEMKRMFARAGYQNIRAEPARLGAPHLKSRFLQLALMAYNAVRLMPIFKQLLQVLGPRWKIGGAAGAG